MGNTPSAVPAAAQINQISIPLQCNTAQYFDTYPSVFSATAPLYSSAGQRISFTDVAAHITLPSFFAPNAIANGSDHFTADVDLLWGTSGSTTFAQQDRKFSFNQTWSNTTLDIFVPSIAVTANSSGYTDLYVQNIFISTYARAPNGSILTSVSTNCFANSNEIVTVPVANTAGPAAPANGFEGSFPQITSGQKASIGNIPIECNDGLNTNLIIGGVSPLKVKPNAQFALSKVTSFFVLPGSLVQALAKVDSGIFVELKRPSDGQNGTTDGLVLQTAGGSPQSYELSRDFMPSESTPNPLNTGVYVPAGSNDDIRFGLPRTGSLNTTATALTGVYQFALDVPNVNVVISTYSLSTGELTDWRQYACTPVAAHRLFATLITTA